MSKTAAVKPETERPLRPAETGEDSTATPAQHRSSPRLRIAQIVTAMDCGGVPDHIVNLACGLSTRNDVAVICRSVDPQYAEALADAGIEVIILPFTRAPNLFADLRSFFSLRAVLRDRGFDVVHTHRSKATLLGLLAARAAGVPATVNTAHMLGFMIIRHAFGRAIFWLYDRLLFAAAADAVITVSESIRSAVIAAGVAPAKKVHTVYYGIKCQRFNAAPPPAGLRRSLGISEDATVVIVVARLVPQKGLDMMVAAAAEVVKISPASRFILVGDGPLRAGLEAQATRLGLDGKLLFLGERTDIPALLKIADIFALSSVAEGLPIAILEAMAASKPVVATAVDGIPEAVKDGENGYIVRSRNSAELAEALGRLIDNPALREHFGRAGRARLEREFSIERMTAKIEALYYGIVARKKRRTRRRAPVQQYARDSASIMESSRHLTM